MLVFVPLEATFSERSIDPAALAGLILIIEDAPADMADHHDHYLYGQPKV